MQETKLYNASIRVVKSLVEQDEFFGTLQVIYEPVIEADSKDAVKKILVDRYPQFFADGKIFERETTNKAQFFYVIIKELSVSEIRDLNSGQWVCDNCGNVHENKYLSRPRPSYKFGETKIFCNSANDSCYTEYKHKLESNSSGLSDDFNYISKDSKHYIYKITEKSTGKSYVGKTRNAPFFRWWNHLTHSKSPFGLHLRTTCISEWNFTVLETLPAETTESEVMLVESRYIKHYDTIANGFNKLVSNKEINDKEAKNIKG